MFLRKFKNIHNGKRAYFKIASKAVNHYMLTPWLTSLKPVSFVSRFVATREEGETVMARSIPSPLIPLGHSLSGSFSLFLPYGGHLPKVNSTFRTLKVAYGSTPTCANIWAIHDTQKDGATRCILGRSTYRPQIYRVCLGIWWQITFFKNEFWTVNE